MQCRSKDLNRYLVEVGYMVRGKEVYSVDVGSNVDDVKGEMAWAKYYFNGRPCKHGMKAVRDKFSKCCCIRCKSRKSEIAKASKGRWEDKTPINLNLDVRKIEVKEAPRLKFVSAARKMVIVNTKTENLLNGVFK